MNNRTMEALQPLHDQLRHVFEVATIEPLQMQIHEWQCKTFPGQSPSGQVEHLKRELDECLAQPDDIEEHADALILLLGFFSRQGHAIEDVIIAAKEKHAKNLLRKWPTAPDEGGVFHHLEEGKAAA